MLNESHKPYSLIYNIFTVAPIQFTAASYKTIFSCSFTNIFFNAISRSPFLFSPKHPKRGFIFCFILILALARTRWSCHVGLRDAFLTSSAVSLNLKKYLSSVNMSLNYRCKTRTRFGNGNCLTSPKSFL